MKSPDTIEEEPVIGNFQDWLNHYENEIKPMREAADEGDELYNPYDEAYNEHLENLHDLIRDDAALLDSASAMLSFIEACADCTSQDELFDFVANNYEKALPEARVKA